MNTKKKFFKWCSILLVAILAICGLKYGLTSNASSTSWNFKNSSFKNLGKITSTKTVNGLSLIATSSKPMEVKKNSQTLNGTEYKYCLALNGSGNTSYRSVKVPVEGNTRLKITLMSNSSSSQRTLAIADGNGKQLSTILAGKSISLQTYDYYGSAGYVYLYSTNSGINIFKIQADTIGGSSSSSSTSGSSDSSSDSNSSNNSSSSSSSNSSGSSNSSSSSSSSTDLSNSGKSQTITSTIVVKANETYDGKGVKIIASGMGDGGQDEGQDPIFKLEKGATLKNVVIGAPGCDGVHCYGNNTIENVVWEDVGEDALTVKGGASADAGTVTVNGGSAKYASDKTFQLNAPCTFVVNNFTAKDIGKLVRQNGGTGFATTIYLNNVTLDTVNHCIAKSDSTSSKLYYYNLNVTNAKDDWQYPNNSSQVFEQEK